MGKKSRRNKNSQTDEELSQIKIKYQNKITLSETIGANFWTNKAGKRLALLSRMIGQGACGGYILCPLAESATARFLSVPSKGKS